MEINREQTARVLVENYEKHLKLHKEITQLTNALKQWTFLDEHYAKVIADYTQDEDDCTTQLKFYIKVSQLIEYELRDTCTRLDDIILGLDK